MNETAEKFIALVRETVGSDRIPQSSAAPNPSPLRQGSLFEPAVLTLAKRHDMAHLLGEKNAEYYQAIYRCAKQDEALKNVCRILSEAEIAHIPLKGAVLRNYYPERWMRTSADIDVLVHPEDLERAADVLCQNGAFVNSGKICAHHADLRTPDGIVLLELHFTLFNDTRRFYNKQILDCPWDYAAPLADGSFQYAFSDSFFYTFHIAHMAKHVLSGGIGVKQYLDLWVLNHRMPHSQAEREALLLQSGLLPFEKKAAALAEKWFGEDSELTDSDSSSPSLDAFEDFVLSSGSYGTLAHLVAGSRAGYGGKSGNLIHRIFMPHRLMTENYPVLKRCPWLLPFFWIYRCFDILFHPSRRRKARLELRENFVRDNEGEEIMSALLQELGLLEKMDI